MNQEEIKKIIPHREPMLLVDEVVCMTPGETIVTRFYVDPARDIFRGHFPGEPVLPGIYTAECMAQTADILFLSMERYTGKIPLLIGMDHIRFFQKIQPGDTIEIRGTLTAEKREKAIATCTAEVYNKDELVASGQVTLAMR